MSNNPAIYSINDSPNVGLGYSVFFSHNCLKSSFLGGAIIMCSNIINIFLCKFRVSVIGTSHFYKTLMPPNDDMPISTGRPTRFQESMSFMTPNLPILAGRIKPLEPFYIPHIN